MLLQRHPSDTPGQLAAELESTTFAYGQNGVSNAVVDDDSGAGNLRLGLTAPIGTIAFEAGGAAYLTDGEAVQELAATGGNPDCVDNKSFDDQNGDGDVQASEVGAALSCGD